MPFAVCMVAFGTRQELYATRSGRYFIEEDYIDQ